MPSFVRAISLIPKPNFSNAEIIAMCSLPVPETKLTATSVSFIFNFNWSPIWFLNSFRPCVESTIMKSAGFSGVKFSLPKSFVIRITFF